MRTGRSALRPLARRGALLLPLASLPFCLSLSLSPLLACDPESFLRKAPGGCRAAGEQCSLEEGPLGVCERAACAPGAEPPCFECTPQH